MNFYEYWPAVRAHWAGEWRGFWGDVQRLDAASRPFAAAALLAGVARGLLPIAALVACFRLVDGLIGSRGVGVRTSDLTHALWLVAGVWAIGFALTLGSARLRGVIAKVVASTATIVFAASMSVCLFLIGPFRFVALLLFVVLSEALPPSRRATGITIFTTLALGVSFFHSVTVFLVSRSVTVGGFVLFAGTAVYATTWLIARKFRSLE